MASSLAVFIALLLYSSAIIAEVQTDVFGPESSSLPPIRIVGDKDYAPIEWLEDGKAKGIIPSILPELARTLNRRIHYQLTDWKQAQELVLKGEADVLTVFSPNSERSKHYDFVDGFLKFELSLFVRSDNVTIHSMDDLAGIKTGVSKGGYLRNLLSRNSQAEQVIIKDHLSGFQQLLNGEIDALATTKWVGAYIIQKHNMDGIKFVEPAIHIKPTHLGVAKGNEELVQALDTAIKRMHRDGTVEYLTRQWEKHEIVYLTQEKLTSIYYTLGLALLGLLVAIALAVIVILKRQVNARTESLQKSNLELEDTISLLTTTQKRLVQSEKVAALSTLVAGLSHEINTPLGISVTLASIMDEETKALKDKIERGNLKHQELVQFADEQLSSGEMLARSLTRAVHLVNSFKKIALDHTKAQRQQFDLSSIINEAVTLHQGQLKQWKVDIIVTVNTPIHLDSFPGALSEILGHLIVNSLRHAFPDIEHPAIDITVNKQDEMAVIEFHDNGHGIEEQYLKRVFDPFFTTQIGQGNSGLGLNFVYTLVTGLLGGEITVVNRQGCHFTITLPINAPIWQEDD